MYKEKAIDRIEKEREDFKSNSPYAKAVKNEVAEALKSFCAQNEEFAQAVAQAGGSFAQACEAIFWEKNIQHISDVECYKRAVGFYFHGATVRCEMTVDLCPDERFPNKSGEEKRGQRGKVISLSLDDLFG